MFSKRGLLRGTIMRHNLFLFCIKDKFVAKSNKRNIGNDSDNRVGCNFELKV